MSVNETDTFTVSDEIRQTVSAFVESTPITQEEVDKYLKVPAIKGPEAIKSSRPSKSSSTVSTEDESAANSTLGSCSSDRPKSTNNSIGSCCSRGNTAKRSAGGRTFISRRYNQMQLKQLLDANIDKQFEDDQWQQHLHGSLRIPSPPQHSAPPITAHPLVGHIPPLPHISERLDAFRRQLPTWALREHILRTVETNTVTLITGGTGCGKTTQVPQFLLENAAQKHRPIRILCTQPRRLAAIAIAKRVATERGERLGATVGYHIRLESNCSADTLLTYCTSGVLLRKLTGDELANEATHVILDEIHERETNTDYLLIALRQALQKRKDLKVVLMSATMGDNRAKFMRYFREAAIKHVDVPAQLFSVEVYHLAETLAMTGYMPNSHFGGMFDERTMNLPPQPFPAPSFFDPFAASQPHNLQYTDPFFNAPWAVSNPFGSAGNVSFAQPQMQNIPPDPFVSASNVAASLDGFALRNKQHSFSSLPDICHKLNALLRDRPVRFLPPYGHRVRDVLNRCVSGKALVEAYMDAGGRQWQDSVDGELIAELICYLVDCQIEGGILVFLPGYDDIMAVNDLIQSMQSQGRFVRRVRLHMLHSMMNTERQQSVFDRVQNDDWERKVVLSTNIAEASLTIDDIVFVIDSGKAKVKGYDHNTRVSQLKCQSIAKSNAEQRKGRAGRCQPGFCFRLYSLEDFYQMDDNQTPEMMRSAIHEVCLHAKMYAPGNLTVKQFLRLAPDPPSEEIVENSLLFLEQLSVFYKTPFPDAPLPPQPPPDKILARCFRRPLRGVSRFESLGYPPRQRVQLYNPYCNWQGEWSPSSLAGAQEAELTELGRTIACLPLEPQLARLLLFGIALRCVGPVLSLVAALSHRDPFVLAINDDQKQMGITARDQFSLMDYSDHLMLIRTFNAYQRVNAAYRENWCRDRLLSESGMRMICGIRHQLFTELRRLRLLPFQMANADDDVNGFNLFASSWPMVQGCIVAGTYPNIGFVRLGSKLNRIRTLVTKNCVLHPSSCLRRQTANPTKRSGVLNEVFGQKVEPNIQYLSYQELVGDAHQQHMVRTVTAVPALHLLLFAGPVRMDSKCVKYFELVDADGSLSLQRKLFRDKILRKHRREQRNFDRELRRKHKENLEKGKRQQQQIEEQRTKHQQEQCEKMRKRQWNNVDNGWEEQTEWEKRVNSESELEREERQTTTDIAQQELGKESEEKGVSNDEDSDNDSFDSCPTAKSAFATTPSSTSSSALSSLDPELAEEMPEYLRTLAQKEPEEPLELLELDQWFGFRGTFNDLQMMMKLRFRLMDYFTRVLSHSVGFELCPQDRCLLDCLNETLTAAHRTQKFAKVSDLGKQSASGKCRLTTR